MTAERSLTPMLALVTCVDAIALDADLVALLAELPEARVTAWDDPSVDWSAFDAAILRSTWNYASRHDDFVDWLRRVATETQLWNPLATVEWNVDKRYLADLAGRRFAVVPSSFVAPGTSVPERIDLDADLVIKPNVGGGSQGVLRTHDRATAAEHIATLHAEGRTAIVQPYQRGVDDHGETGLVYLGGRFSHAFRKAPILTGPIEWEGALFAKETIGACRPTDAERELGDRLVASVGPTAYARVDLVPGPSGPLVLELELTEPSLFLDTDPGASERAAAAFRSLAT